jgi:Spy/CpxP family protein refolding chaperone
MSLSQLLVIVIAVSVTWPGCAAAQQSPYVGQASRGVKALSDQEIADYLNGKGMGYAKAAELNGYPGPAHVLELAEDLRLTADQRARTQQLFQAMHADAMTVGRALVDRERQLDAAFASKTITAESLSRATAEIASLQGRLRDIHLSAHLAQSRVLDPQQVQQYDELRGYRKDTSPAGHSHRGH